MWGQRPCTCPVFMTKKQTENWKAGIDFAQWLAVRCPTNVPMRDYQRVLRAFLGGKLILVRTLPVTADASKVQIWVD
jgi:hypothetical protein